MIVVMAFFLQVIWMDWMDGWRVILLPCLLYIYRDSYQFSTLNGGYMDGGEPVQLIFIYLLF